MQQNKNEAHAFFRKSLWLYFFTFLAAPIGYFIKIIITSGLSVADVGLIYSVLSLILLLSVYNDLGLTEALNYYLPRYRLEGDDGVKRTKTLLLVTVIAQFVSASLITVGLYFWRDFLSLHLFRTPQAADVIIGFIPYFFLVNIFQVVTTIFMSYEEPKYPKFAEFLRQLTSLGIVAWLFFGGNPSITSVLWSFNTGLLIGTIILLILAIKTYRVPFWSVSGISKNMTEYRDISRYALWVLFTANVGVVLSQIDMQIITAYLGTESAGYYSMYLSLISIPFLVTGPIFGLYLPMLARYFKAWNNSGVQNLYTFFLTYLIIFALWTSAYFFVFSRDLAISFFGEKFAFSGDILRVSVPFLVINFILQLDFNSLASIGKIKVRAKALLIGLAFNIPLTLMLIPKFWVLGAAGAVSLSWFVIAAIAHSAIPFASRSPDWFIIRKSIAWVTLTSILVFMSIWWIESLHVNISSVRWSSILSLGFGALLFILVFVLFHYQEFRSIASLIRQKKQEDS